MGNFKVLRLPHRDRRLGTLLSATAASMISLSRSATADSKVTTGPQALAIPA
jgi:hypothetical protein